MPIYEYQCEKCQHHFDVLQKMSDEPLQVCPECQQPSLKKMVSAPRFKLTGTGWYETDFKDKKESKVTSDTASITPTATSEAKSAEAATTPEVKSAKVETD